jgi:hypothetical protein
VKPSDFQIRSAPNCPEKAMAKLTNRYNRYDVESKLWIQSRKRVYLYWYRFLQEAEANADYKVDWSIYKAWGGKTAIFPPKSGDFDSFWSANWKTLFGMPDRDGSPLFPLSVRNPRADYQRATLLVYQISRDYPQKTNIQVLHDLINRIPDDSGSDYLLNLKKLAGDVSRYEYAARTVSRLRLESGPINRLERRQAA